MEPERLSCSRYPVKGKKDRSRPLDQRLWLCFGPNGAHNVSGKDLRIGHSGRSGGEARKLR